MTVDNGQKARFQAPGAWNTSSYSSQRFGKNYAYARPSKARPARFKVRIPATARYAVYARWPANRGYNAATAFGVRTTDGLRWKRVDQRKTGDRWVKLGVHRIAKGDNNKVFVSRRARGNGYVIADAVRVARVTSKQTSGDSGSNTRNTRGPDGMLGSPRYTQREATSYARSVGASRYIMRTIPIYYDLAPRIGIAPDVLVAQSILETGRGRYGGDSKPWNMAGIKKGGNVGDAPRDFERPRTPRAGVRMHVNHMAAYTGKRTIGKPHDRFYDARAAQKNRGWWVKRISQLGGGAWATDPAYSRKIRSILDDM
jgi:flagellum-specific peptidoglycan hydrolase FlgJ